MKNLILVAALFPLLSHSQIRTQIDNLDNQRGKVFDVKRSDVSIYNGIDGKPYISEDFKNILVEGYSSKLPPLRYNVYADEMEFKAGDVLNYIDKSSGEMRIKFVDENKVYLLSKYNFENKLTNGYLVEKVKGGENKYGLYMKENMVLIENQNSATNSYLKQKNPYFQKEKDLTLISFGNIYYKFPKNIKDLKNILNINDPKIDEYIKFNKINFNKLSDQEKLVQFLNTL